MPQVRRQGHPAGIAILLADVMQRLLAGGHVGFAASVDRKDFSALPSLVPLSGMSRAQAVGPDGSVLNTCSADALAELLRQLKRAYWPFAWDTRVDSPADGGAGSHGGFRCAALAQVLPCCCRESSCRWQTPAGMVLCLVPCRDLRACLRPIRAAACAQGCCKGGGGRGDERCAARREHGGQLAPGARHLD